MYFVSSYHKSRCYSGGTGLQQENLEKQNKKNNPTPNENYYIRSLLPSEYCFTALLQSFPSLCPNL